VDVLLNLTEFPETTFPGKEGHTNYNYFYINEFSGMQDKFETERLVLTRISVQDALFFYHLVNTPPWIRFIGDRNIHTVDEAEQYIEKLIINPHIIYWVVTLKAGNTSIGIISFIKRDYLDYHDIGFALLPQYTHNGYAYEASGKVLNYATGILKMPVIAATTIRINVPSIRLLEKLNFRYNKSIEVGDEELLVYTTSSLQTNRG